MRTLPTKVIDSVVIQQVVHRDARGSFQEIFKKNQVLGPQSPFHSEVRQVNMSVSAKNVIRGIHVSPYPKLCTCISGSLFDVVVDLREDSTTYLQWDGVWLHSGDFTQLYVPAGCGHGFFSAKDNTTLLYVQGGVYDPDQDQCVRWDSLGIEWPEPSYILSEKDQNAIAWDATA